MQRRILLLATDLGIGGTPTVVRELATRLNGPDFLVQVACLDRMGLVGEEIQARGIGVTALNAAGRFDGRVILRLVRLIRREKIDTVLSFLIHANAAAAVASYFVNKVRCFQSIQTTQAKPRWHWQVQRVISHRAEKIVVPSESVAEVAMQWARVEAGRVRVIPNAVDLAEFSEIRPEAGGKRIGFIGRLDPIKRVEDLVAAMALLEASFTLDIFGDGAIRERLQEQIAQLGLGSRVLLHGEIARPAEALAKIDLLVLPSDAEGFGLVLIEAMAAGVPVIGTNVAGIRNVIEDGVSGVLCEARNPNKLAEGIRRVMGDGELRARLTAGGRERVERCFAWENVIEEYRDLLA